MTRCAIKNKDFLKVQLGQTWRLGALVVSGLLNHKFSKAQRHTRADSWWTLCPEFGAQGYKDKRT